MKPSTSSAEPQVAESSSTAARQSWFAALGVYLHARVLTMLFLGFSAGLPFLLIFATLSAWLREAGLAVSAIGFFSWAGLAFSVKILWAPVVDRLALPWLTRRLGRRRSWMLFAQSGIALGLAGLALANPGEEVAWVALCAVTIAVFSASQDVAIDAYRIEAVEKDLQGAMAASYILGYRIALLIGGAGALYLADFGSWSLAYGVMAGLMLVGVATVLAIAEPEASRDRLSELAGGQPPPAWLEQRRLGPRGRSIGLWIHTAVVMPVLEIFQRLGRLALLILFFVSIYRLSDITMGVMANPFYIDLGFTKSEIATVTKVFGFFMAIGGAFLGGLLVARFGILRPLLAGAILTAATNLLFAVMAWVGPDIRLLTLTISADNLSGGLAGAVFIAYLSSLTNTRYTATQYALFSSLMTLPGKLLGGFSGVIVDAAGYVNFFFFAGALGLPAIFIAIYLMSRGPVMQASVAEESAVARPEVGR